MAKKRRRRIRMQPRFFLIMLAVLGTIIIVLLLVKKVQNDKKEVLETTPVPTATLAPTATPNPALPDDVTITRVDSANPSQYGFSSALKVNGKDTTSFNRSDSLSFGRDIEYSALPGVTTFGGNNYRDSFAYGIATVSDKRLREQWTKTIARLATGVAPAGQDSRSSYSGRLKP
jgi:hypothetical protein